MRRFDLIRLVGMGIVCLVLCSGAVGAASWQWRLDLGEMEEASGQNWDLEKNDQYETNVSFPNPCPRLYTEDQLDAEGNVKTYAADVHDNFDGSLLESAGDSMEKGHVMIDETTGNPVHEWLDFEGEEHINAKIKFLTEERRLRDSRINYHWSHGALKGVGRDSGGEYISNGVLNATWDNSGEDSIRVVFICHYVNRQQPKTSQNFFLHIAASIDGQGPWNFTRWGKFAKCTGAGMGNETICFRDSTDPQCSCDFDPDFPWCPGTELP